MSEKRASALPCSDRPMVFFDFDGTLTTGDTLMPFLKFVAGKPKYYWNLLLVSPALAGYFLKFVRNDIAKQSVFKRYLAGYHIDKLFTLGERFSEEVIPSLLRPEGMQQLRWHQQQGHFCVLVSASLDIYLQFWAEKQGFDHLISSELQKTEAGYVTGYLQGNNCFGEEKVTRINRWAKGNLPAITYAYGDSKGDMPMLQAVTYGKILKNNKFIKIF